MLEVVYAVITILLCVVAVIDGREKRIPNRLLVVYAALAGISIYLEEKRSSNAGWMIRSDIDFSDRLVGALLVSAIFILLMSIRPGAFGLGDVKLMAVSGMMLGSKRNMMAFVIAVFTAGIWCVAGLLRKKTDLKSEISFGPFLVLGVIFCIWCTDEVVAYFF